MFYKTCFTLLDLFVWPPRKTSLQNNVGWCFTMLYSFGRGLSVMQLQTWPECVSFLERSYNASCFILLVFTKRSRDHKIPLNSRCHFFVFRNGYISVILVKLPIFGFLVILFGEVAVIQKFRCLGRPCWTTRMSVQHGRPIQKLSLILKFLNYSYFTKMATRKPSPKMATWLTWPISIHLWSQKRGVLWSRDVTWKPRIGIDSLFTGIMTPVKCLFALEMNWMH